MNVARRYFNEFVGWFSSLQLQAQGFDWVDTEAARLYVLAEPAEQRSEWAKNSILKNLKVWIRLDDGLPLEIVAGPDEGRPRIVVTFYDYNQPIAIKPPIP